MTGRNVEATTTEGENLAMEREKMQRLRSSHKIKKIISELEGGERRGDQYQGTKRRFLKREKIKVKITDGVGKRKKINK